MPLSATELSMARVRRVVGAEADDGTDVADTVLVVGGEAVEAESVAVAVHLVVEVVPGVVGVEAAPHKYHKHDDLFVHTCHFPGSHTDICNFRWRHCSALS